ncbi:MULTISPECIES: hypothetical protein [unclassified Ruegeria]|nr:MULTISPECIES: hypothetical protein [unclassified Ruegeria]NOD33727.1 hypothetical protein [Ruegeria sp. HKCCD7296]NOD45974.1 hypothetical protein [Ruegeria sp. HKCCD5849]NOD50726.1 hypothetical protein [Ruegeria sp. HKCCD5851]NOD67542.1 hypothetical protein [Ruegeria sp. HKCCD7303]NOE33128.1 hypothetical protein [Ruegeria sp. HKCCD7318]
MAQPNGAGRGASNKLKETETHAMSGDQNLVTRTPLSHGHIEGGKA